MGLAMLAGLSGGGAALGVFLSVYAERDGKRDAFLNCLIQNELRDIQRWQFVA